MKNKIKLKNGVLACAILLLSASVQAEVLVILPESGPMARAGFSIRQGIESAHRLSGSHIELKFVNSDQQSIKSILKQHVSSSTQMIIGPVARPDIEALIAENPRPLVLALNEVDSKKANIIQFSLSKDADAKALIDQFNKDQLSKLYILSQPEKANDSAGLRKALKENYRGQLVELYRLPSQLEAQAGLLLLGDNQWLNSLSKLPAHRIYTLTNAIEDAGTLPKGIKFCDVPAIYSIYWKDVVQAYRANPVNMSYQRLIAFGGDSWQLAEYMIRHPQINHMNLSGRTGRLVILGNKIERKPQCFLYNGKTVEFL